jgi:hypothetical protein
MTDFPVLDSPRDSEYDDGRVILTEHGVIEAYVGEIDSWCSVPVRVTHGPLNGVTLELGPYDLDRRDVARLREAIRAYDVANNGPTMRRVK